MGASSPEISTKEAIAAFLAAGRYRRLAPATLDAYRWALNRLESHCLLLPTRSNALLPVLGDRKLALESTRDLRRVLISFFKWAAREYKVPNPTVDLERLPRRRQLPVVLEPDQVRKLMEVAGDGRDRAMLALVLDTGIRLGELVGLQRSDVGVTMRVTGKSGTRQVPISDQVRELVLALVEAGPMWIGLKGQLTRDGVRQVFERLFRRAGITGRKCRGPHILRHTFGTFYCRAGGNVRILQEIMGHRNITTTMIYVHLAGRDVAKDHALYSPIQTMGLVA